MNVSAIIVTRGNVPLDEILESLPNDWEKIVWDNGLGRCVNHTTGETEVGCGDLSVYGRYAAITHAAGELIYVQDDDVIVSEPGLIVRQWQCGDSFDNTNWLRQVPIDQNASYKEAVWRDNPRDYGYVVCNMPPQFRHDFYQEHALVGFGAAFHRDLPFKAFARFPAPWDDENMKDGDYWATRTRYMTDYNMSWDSWRRTCDVVFTALTPRILVDISVRNLPWATADDRMYRQKEHFGERKRMLELACKVGRSV